MFKNEFKKTYSTPIEEEFRKKVFKENLISLKVIISNNSKNDMEFGVTTFYDITDEEFSK